MVGSVMPSGLFGFEPLKVSGLFFQLSEVCYHPAFERSVGEFLPFLREVVSKAATTCRMMDSDYLPSIVLSHNLFQALERLAPEAYNMLSRRHKSLNYLSEESFPTILEGLYRDPSRCRRPFAKHCFRPK